MLKLARLVIRHDIPRHPVHRRVWRRDTRSQALLGEEQSKVRGGWTGSDLGECGEGVGGGERERESGERERELQDACQCTSSSWTGTLRA